MTWSLREPHPSVAFESSPTNTTPSRPISRHAVPTYYQQPCPTCGRPLLIQVHYLGQQVFCRHCRCEFVAHDPAQKPRPNTEGTGSLIDQAERLLALLEWASGSGRRLCG